MQQELTRTTRALCRTRLVLYNFTFIAALNLLPILIWHNSTMHWFEDYHMNKRLEDALRQEQLGGVETLLWVAVWILVPVDVVNAIRKLGQCQELLHPRVRTFGSDDDIALSDSSKHDTTTHDIARRLPLLDHLLQMLLSGPCQFILSLLYESTMLLVLTSHVYVFFSLRAPSRAICDTVDPDLYSERNTSQISHSFSDREKCKRHNWNFFAAGYFSSGMASLLAVSHVAAVFCTLIEVVNSWVYNGKGEDKSACLDAPRDVDIRTREDGTSRTTGRLTAISEEENCAGSGWLTRRRTDRSKSSDGQQSKASSGGSSRLEEVLLECLVD